MRAMIAVVAGLAACGGGGDDAVSTVLAGDVSELARVATETSDGAAAMPGDATTSDACYATWGSCQLCYALDGGPLHGSYTAGIDAPPCSADRTGRFGTGTYTVSSFDLAGDWDGTLAGSYTITASGTRNAELLLEGQRAEHGLDSSFSLDSLNATTADYVLDTFSAEMTYSSFARHVWTVSVDGTAATIAGTATRDDGASCSIDGGADAPIVICSTGR